MVGGVPRRVKLWYGPRANYFKSHSTTPRTREEVSLQIRAPRNRSALAITDTELKLIAAAAIIGLSRMPKKG